MDEELLTVHEAAKALRLSVWTLYGRVSRGQMPHVKIGRSLRFRPSDLKNLIRAGLRPAAKRGKVRK